MNADENKKQVIEYLDAQGAAQTKLDIVDKLLDAKHGGGKPGIHLTPDRVACPGHMAPFRERWPIGWGVFALKLLDRVIKNPKVQSELNGKPDTVAAFNALLDQCPMCCRATPRLLLEAYDETQQVVAAAGELPGGALWPVRLCTRCSKRDRAALIQFTLPKRMEPSFVWVCLPCVARFRSPKAASYGVASFRRR